MMIKESQVIFTFTNMEPMTSCFKDVVELLTDHKFNFEVDYYMDTHHELIDVTVYFTNITIVDKLIIIINKHEEDYEKHLTEKGE